MRHYLGAAIGLLFIGGVAAIIIHEHNRSPEQPPLWFSGNKVEWASKHKTTPAGYDEVSRAIIRTEGIVYVPWEPDRLWAYVGNSNRRHQWLDDKLLVRYLTGEASIFSGGGRLHPPLAADPYAAKKPLQDCLADDDDGLMPRDFKRGRSLTEALQDSGAKVEQR